MLHSSAEIEFGDMTNPWLQIPLSDYETHMALPHVRQAELLSSIFGSALDTYAPRSIALLGCAGGNGLEQLEGRELGRVVAVDINPVYSTCAPDGAVASRGST